MPPMREARICYDHLAGERAVTMFDGFLARDILLRDGDEIRLATKGASSSKRSASTPKRCPARDARPAAPASTGASGARISPATLGAAILEKILAEKWARREPESRAIVFSPKGKMAFEKTFLG